MNKRLDDRLLELAFDSRSPELPNEMRQDSEAATRLDEYAKMKSALSAMRDIPEHQLSTERLRAALLHQDLKRRFAFPWQSVGYAATASVLFIGAFVAGHTLRQPHPAETKLVLGAPKQQKMFGSSTPVIHVAPMAKRSEQIKSLASVKRMDPTRHSNANLALNDEVDDYSVKSSMQNVVDYHATPAYSNSLVKAAGLSPVPAGALHPTLANMKSVNGPTGTPKVNGKQVANDKVVVLQDDTDSTSGLDTAQEVTANHDVLYGG